MMLIYLRYKLCQNNWDWEACVNGTIDRVHPSQNISQCLFLRLTVGVNQSKPASWHV